MHKGELESLLSKAKALEKNYEWLQAAEIYCKAVDLASKKKILSKAAKFQERLGFCFYKAAFQAKTTAEFRNRMKMAIQLYEKESKLLYEAGKEENQVRIKHADALVSYAKSWLVTDPLRKKKLLDTWWKLETQVLKAYEILGDLHSVGRSCNNLIEYSCYDQPYLVSGFAERAKIYEENINLAEKAIQIFSELNDNYELAKAYCFAGKWFGNRERSQIAEDKLGEFDNKHRNYVETALEISKKIGDAWLISMSYSAGWHPGHIEKSKSPYGLEYSKRILEFGLIAKDNLLIAYGKNAVSFSTCVVGMILEDPDEQKEAFKKACETAEEAEYHSKLSNHIPSRGCYNLSLALHSLIPVETDSETKQNLLEKDRKVIQEGMERLRGWQSYSGSFSSLLTSHYRLLAKTKSNVKEKKDLLLEAQLNAKKFIAHNKIYFPKKRLWPFLQLASVQYALASIETDTKKKIEFFKKTVNSFEVCIQPIEKRKKRAVGGWWGGGMFGPTYYLFGRVLQQFYYLTKEKTKLFGAVEVYKKAIPLFKSTDLPTRVAECYWRIAQTLDLLGDFKKASVNYELVAEAYDLASKKIPQLEQFYGKYSSYMRAWSQIEQSRYYHAIEEYEKAKEHYEKAAKLHEKSELWKYLTQNYFAWANLEEAENFSRKENALLAKQAFQKALEQFVKSEENIKQELGEIKATEEKEMTMRLCKAADLRRKYCQARVLVEDAKLLDREGKYLQSSESYGEAAKHISAIIEKMEVKAERKELEYMTVLCRAWEMMAVAEERASSESYLEAAKFFEQAKDYCYTKKASLWVLGNSNFCKGLAAGKRYQASMDLKDNALAKRYIKSAASSYLQAGFKHASEYARATQRLFDAYVFINQAEGEADPENKAKQYQMAEKLLQISAVSFMKAKQPEKKAQVKQLLDTITEEKDLAISLDEVMHAPTITSSTTAFTAPSATSEASVGLESFEHANVQANLVVGLKEVRVGESFCLSVEFVNAGKEPALLTRVEGFVPPDFVVVEKPEIYRLEDSRLNMKGKQIAPLKLVEAKVVLQPSKKGVYQLNPKVHYLDENGQNKSLQLKSTEIKVQEVVLANRVSTGTKELDALLLGGIPEEYAVVLTGSPSDERELVIANFLQVGEGEASFCVATEAVGLENLLKKPGFYLFLCNPRPMVQIPDLPNVRRLSSKTDINNLNIALVQTNRRLSQKQSIRKRLCLGVVSDVLLRLGPEITRRWLSELITDLKSKGFTVLAVMDSSMHPADQVNAVLNLFDGEISLTQTEDPLERRKSLRVKKLRNQDYIENPICLRTYGIKSNSSASGDQ